MPHDSWGLHRGQVEADKVRSFPQQFTMGLGQEQGPTSHRAPAGARQAWSDHPQGPQTSYNVSLISSNIYAILTRGRGSVIIKEDIYNIWSSKTKSQIQDVCKVFGRYLEGVWEVSGGSLECVGKVSGRPQEGVKVFCIFYPYFALLSILPLLSLLPGVLKYFDQNFAILTYLTFLTLITRGPDF